MDKENADLKNYEQKCNNIGVKEEKEKMIPVCQKYLRFLDTSISWSRLFTGFDVSLLLNYWIYDKLTQIYRDNENYKIDFGFAALQFIWSRFNNNRIEKSYYDKCWPDTRKVYHEDWEKIKQLYEYYVDYDILFGSASTNDKSCKEYYKKIKEYFSLYEYFQGKCPTTGYICPDFFHKLKNEKRKYKLENLPCYREMEQAITAAAAQAKASPSHHPPGHERGPAPPGDGLGSPGSKIGTLDAESSPESSDIGTKVTNSVLGAAPVLLTATALYRYTPLGPWIRRFGGGRTNSMGAMDTFSPYTPETGDMFSHASENYISYQPM
ncbi:VIR protein [Plasmodium vivax]|uniref:VIR protein n=1 Tax=Plasmodium vivax TaxID=5855 RepID=A0A1G4E6J6_PLAVI|nr:VIR protein [Plasmodium vivax]